MKLSKMAYIGSLMLASLHFSTMASAHDNATTQQYRMVSISATATKQISNDQMQAVLSIEKSHKQANELANQVNKLMNFAIQTSKKYPSIKSKTGNQHTYPIYDQDNNRKLKEWRSNAHIELESKDFTAMSKLIAELQQHFQLDNISFSVSDEQRTTVENELLTEVSKNFQKRAQLIAQSWNKTNYELVNLNIDTQNNFYAAPMAAMARSAKVETFSISPQEVNSGESRITINAHGSVQLK